MRKVLLSSGSVGCVGLSKHVPVSTRKLSSEFSRRSGSKPKNIVHFGKGAFLRSFSDEKNEEIEGESDGEEEEEEEEEEGSHFCSLSSMNNFSEVFRRVMETSGGSKSEKIIEGVDDYSGPMTFNPCAKRGNIYYNVEYLGISESMEKCYKEELGGLSYLVITRGSSYTIQFHRRGTIHEFHFSEMSHPPVVHRGTATFVFNREGVKDGACWVKLRYRDAWELKKQMKLYENYFQSKTEEELSRKIDEIVPDHQLFHTIPAKKWTVEQIKVWLQHVMYQPFHKREVTTVYDYIKSLKIEDLDYSIFRVRNLQNFLYKCKNVDVKEEEEKKILDEPMLRRVILPKVEGKSEEIDESIASTLENEITRILVNDGRFNLKFYSVLRKILGDYSRPDKKGLMKERGKDVEIPFLQSYDFRDALPEAKCVCLYDILYELTNSFRHHWSEGDCVDHIISLLFSGMSVERYVEVLTDDFEKEEKRCNLSNLLENELKRMEEDKKNEDETKSGTSKTFEDWKKWKELLERFNESRSAVGQEKLGFELEKVSFSVKKKLEMYELKDELEEAMEVANDDLARALKRRRVRKKKKDLIKKYFREVRVLEKKLKEKLEEVKEMEVNPRDVNNFLLSEKRKKYIQEKLLEKLSLTAKDRMSEFGVKLVLCLTKAAKDGKKNQGQGGKGKGFLLSALSKGVKIVVRPFAKLSPGFVRFGLCHVGVTVANLAFHWFSDSLVHIADKAVKMDYEEIAALETDCHVLLLSGSKSAYERIIDLAKFVVDSNVKYKYGKHLETLFSENKINCQQFATILLEKLGFVDNGNSEMDIYRRQFCKKYMDLALNNMALKPEDTLNSRWLPLTERFKGEFMKEILLHTGEDALRKGVDRIYFKSHEEVDMFARALIQKHREVKRVFQGEYKGVYELLKSFDRAFSMIDPTVFLECPFN